MQRIRVAVGCRWSARNRPAAPAAVGSAERPTASPPAVARVELLGVEEEQLVVAARLSDRAADREPDVLLPSIPVLGTPFRIVGLAVGVPVGVAAHVVAPIRGTGSSRSS